MDTLSSSVSSFKVHGLHSLPCHLSHFRTPTTPHHPPPINPHLSSTTKPKPNSLSNRPTSQKLHYYNNFSAPPFPSSSQTFSLKQCPPIVRIKAATGYATALLDIARSNNTIESIARDVRRFTKLLRNKQIRAIMSDRCLEEREKGNVIKEVAVKGNFHKHLVGMVKMLVEKGKLGIVSEFLGEFEAIYDELCGSQVVLTV